MDKHQLLTDEELAMLRDLGNDEDIATSQYLRGTLPLPLQSLLQRAKPLTLEARIAGYQLRFPLHCTQAEEGHAELRIAAPTITELGSPHLRAWRLDEKAVLCTEDAEYEVYSLSLGGLIVAGLPDSSAKGDPLGGYLRIEDLPPLAMTGTLIRHVEPINITMTGPSSSGWARRIRNNCGTGSSSATRTPSSKPIRVTKDNRGARLPCCLSPTFNQR